MTTPFSAILEDFEEELLVIKALVHASADPALGRPKARVAGANAAVLLLAANFEEFIRQMARAFAKSVVTLCSSFDCLPPKLAAIAWKRTLEGMARIRLDSPAGSLSQEGIFADALTRFTVVYEFCRGDLSQDVYQDLIHNENNMRSQEINSLFKLSGLGNVCARAAGRQVLMDYLHEDDPDRANSTATTLIDQFFERRNLVAHSINAMQSSGPQQIGEDIELLSRFGRALTDILQDQFPPPIEGPASH